MHGTGIHKSLARFIIAFLCLGLAAVGCKPTETARESSEAEQAVVKINGQPITKGDIQRRLQARDGDMEEAKMHPNQWQRMVEAATEEEILDRLLLQAASAQGVIIPPAELDTSLRRSKEMLGAEAFQDMLESRGATEQEFREFLKKSMTIERFKETLFKEIALDEAKLREYYQGHEQSFLLPDSVRLEVVIVEDLNDAEKIYGSLRQGEEFDDVLKEHFEIDPSMRGGRMRWMPYDKVPEAFREKVKTSPVGQILEPVQLSDGHSVVKILDKRPAGLLSFEQARDEIENMLTAREQQKILDRWYETEKQKSVIEYVR